MSEKSICGAPDPLIKYVAKILMYFDIFRYFREVTRSLSTLIAVTVNKDIAHKMSRTMSDFFSNVIEI